MTNNFVAIKENQASKKFYLVRITPARFVNDLLTDNGGGQYEMSFNYTIESVKQNGVSLSKVTGTPSAGEYSHENNVLLLNTATTPSSSSAIVVFYHIFLTDERNRVVGIDPEIPTVDLRDWLPLLNRGPKINFSAENILAGILSINASSISFINNQGQFNQYLTNEDSFYKKSVKIWICLDSTDNIQKIYDGKIIKVSTSRTELNFNLEDNLTLLKEPAYLGDSTKYNYFTVDDYPNIDPNKAGQPIRYYIGTLSRHQLISQTVSGLAEAQKLDFESLDEANCTGYSITISTSTNREWGIGRTSSDGFLQFGFTPSVVDNSNPNFTKLTGTNAEIIKFHIGDTFSTNVAANYGRVLYVDRINNFIYVTKMAGFTLTKVVQSNDCPTVLVQDELGAVYYCLYGRDYTATVTATDGGNKYLKITFVNNFEANHAGLTPLDSGIHIVRFRVKTVTTNAKHGDVVKLLVESSGLTIDSSDITAVNAALSSNCNFSIPTFNQNDYRGYYEYLQDILKSTLGYLYLRNDFNLGYKLFETPSSALEVSDTDIIEDSFSIDLEYQDIVTELIAYNVHYSSSEVSANSSLTRRNNKAAYLHQVNNADRFIHVLEDISARIDALMSIYSERKALYNFTTKIINIDSVVGDNFKLNKRYLLGEDLTRDVTIISLGKSTDSTDVIATDLFNI